MKHEDRRCCGKNLGVQSFNYPVIFRNLGFVALHLVGKCIIPDNHCRSPWISQGSQGFLLFKVCLVFFFDLEKPWNFMFQVDTSNRKHSMWPWYIHLNLDLPVWVQNEWFLKGANLPIISGLRTAPLLEGAGTFTIHGSTKVVNFYLREV